MKSPRTIAMLLIGASIVSALLLSSARKMYFSPRAELKAEISELSGKLEGYRKVVNREPEQRRRLRDIVNRTLGDEREVVDHALRTRLNRIAESTGLSAGSVGTGKVAARKTPATSKYRQRDLKHRIDFVELDAWVSGSGTLEQAIELIDRLDVEPWLHRIDSVRLSPKNNGSQFDISVRLTTLFIPGKTPTEPLVYGESFSARNPDRTARLVSANPFRLPPPEPETKPAPPSQPEPEIKPEPKPKRFNFGAWVVSGAADAGDGPEVWLRHRKSGERRRLVVGESIHTMKFEGSRGIVAVFSINEEWFEVPVGQDLSHRESVSR
ncbi:MAG: hypothetical protein AAF432_03535 [Planctomycetota bacterium]